MGSHAFISVKHPSHHYHHIIVPFQGLSWSQVASQRQEPVPPEFPLVHSHSIAFALSTATPRAFSEGSAVPQQQSPPSERPLDFRPADVRVPIPGTIAVDL
ncbi:hypothetical protein MRX96_053488 [Rhipicephalus microplus]